MENAHANRGRRFGSLILIFLLLAVGVGLFLSKDRSHGLKPGDICSLGLDVQRNEDASSIKLMTIYGSEVKEPPSLFSPGNFGQRQPRLQLAVLLPQGATINGTGLNSGYGKDWSVLRETLSWGAQTTPGDLNSAVQKTLSYEYDGRGDELRIAGQNFRLAEGTQFVVVMDDKWSPTVFREDVAPYPSPVLKAHEEELRTFFRKQ